MEITGEQLQEKIKALAKEFAPAQIAVRHHLQLLLNPNLEVKSLYLQQQDIRRQLHN
jgi:hypothetical protein